MARRRRRPPCRHVAAPLGRSTMACTYTTAAYSYARRPFVTRVATVHVLFISCPNRLTMSCRRGFLIFFPREFPTAAGVGIATSWSKALPRHGPRHLGSDQQARISTYLYFICLYASGISSFYSNATVCQLVGQPVMYRQP